MKEDAKFVRVERGVQSQTPGRHWVRVHIGPAQLLLTPTECEQLENALRDVREGKPVADVEVI